MIEYSVDVNATRLILSLGQLPAEMQARLKDKIGDLTDRLLRMVQAREPVRTGRLRSQTHSYVDENKLKQFTRGRVRILPVQEGINRTAAAFGALEYGGPGTSGRRSGPVEIKSYRRSGTTVRAYKRRRPTINARRFLRGPGAIMIPIARRELEETINATVRDALKP